MFIHFSKPWSFRFWLIFTALIQLLAAGFHRLSGFGLPIADRVGPSGPEMPSGYAFLIWLPIFVLSLLYALGSLQHDSQRRESIYQMALPVSMLFNLAAFWMFWVELRGLDIVSALIISAMFLLARRILFWSVKENRKVFFNRFVVWPLFGLYAGWLSAAVCLNWLSVLRRQLLLSGFSTSSLAFLTLLAIVLIALRFISQLRGRNLWYAGAILWALAAIFVTNFWDHYNPLFILLSILSFAVTISWLWFHSCLFGRCRL